MFSGDELSIRYAKRDLALTLPTVLGLTPGRAVAVQAGGNLGVYADELAQYFRAVYTFEPDAEMFRQLMHNVGSRDNAVAMRAALGDQHAMVGTTRARRDSKSGPVHDALTHISGPGIVPTLRVDDLGLDFLDVLWLDVEGHEYDVLLGARETMQKYRPTVVVEINEQCEIRGIQPEDIRTLLRMTGYEFVVRIKADEVYTWRK